MSTFSGIMTVVYTSVFTSFMGMGETFLFPILTAVFMGGTPITGGSGSITGSLIATIILSFLASGLISIGITGFATRIAYGTILVLVLVLNAKFGRYRLKR
jgi:simple sugar transport system permease protein